ncbi:hypothetical protein Tco_1539560 [Tanacetum coccineum]
MEGKGFRPNSGEQDEGQARPNPSIAAESHFQTSHVERISKLPTEDQFFMEKPHEEESGKTNAETEVQSMVSVPIHQDTSSVPPMTTLEEARKKETNVDVSSQEPPPRSPPSPPPPPPPPAGASSAPDDSILDEQLHLSDNEDSGNDHIPKANLRQDWWKPLPEKERPATPEPAWTISSSNKSDVANN